jgi:hypothetical protein
MVSSLLRRALTQDRRWDSITLALSITCDPLTPVACSGGGLLLRAHGLTSVLALMLP